MCSFWPAHYFLAHIALFGLLWLASVKMTGEVAQTTHYEVWFEPTGKKEVVMDSRDPSAFNVSFVPRQSVLDQEEDDKDHFIEVVYYSSDPHIGSVFPEREAINFSNGIQDENNFTSTIYVTGEFIGHAKICAEIQGSNNDCVDISVVRESSPIDKAFTYSVVALVAIIYVNMGAALDTSVIKGTLKRPIGPVIGFISQFVIMPLLSYGIGKILIPDESLQLGLFITGCSPGGGASNIWTLALGGNLDLSITMTTISTFAAFVMMPLWILYFGKLITSDGNMRIPNSKIATFAASLIVPLAIGIFVKRKFPKVVAVLVRMLKPFSVFLIGFIVVFAIYTNAYLFKLFSWQILVAGMLLPWLGYIFGAGCAFLCQQNWRDSLAIGIETGVQNTGLAIFVLRFSLDQPDSDLTTVMPVAVAIMTPVLPMVILIGMKVAERVKAKSKKSTENMVGSCTEISVID